MPLILFCETIIMAEAESFLSKDKNLKNKI